MASVDKKKLLKPVQSDSKLNKIISSVHTPKKRKSILFNLSFALFFLVFLIITLSFGLVASLNFKLYLMFGLLSIFNTASIICWIFLLFSLISRLKIGVFSVTQEGISFYIRDKLSLKSLIYTSFEQIDRYYLKKDSTSINGISYPTLFFYLKDGKLCNSGPITESELNKVLKILKKMKINGE